VATPSRERRTDLVAAVLSRAEKSGLLKERTVV